MWRLVVFELCSYQHFSPRQFIMNNRKSLTTRTLTSTGQTNSSLSEWSNCQKRGLKTFPAQYGHERRSQFWCLCLFWPFVLMFSGSGQCPSWFGTQWWAGLLNNAGWFFLINSRMLLPSAVVWPLVLTKTRHNLRLHILHYHKREFHCSTMRNILIWTKTHIYQ